MANLNLNYLTLFIFAPILILTGILGFILPTGWLSNAPAYNTFHIIFGLIGLISGWSKKMHWIRGFNISFGLIDFYQGVAGLMNWFPESHFQWTTADDILHFVIGGSLVLIGLFANKSETEINDN